jgi:hypothetical protein
LDGWFNHWYYCYYKLIARLREKRLVRPKEESEIVPFTIGVSFLIVFLILGLNNLLANDEIKIEKSVVSQKCIGRNSHVHFKSEKTGKTFDTVHFPKDLQFHEIAVGDTFNLCTQNGFWGIELFYLE